MPLGTQGEIGGVPVPHYTPNKTWDDRSNTPAPRETFLPADPNLELIPGWGSANTYQSQQQDQNTNQWVDYLNGVYGPQQTLLDQQRARQQQALALQTADYGAQRGFMRQGFDNDLAALGLSRQQIGLDKRDILAELANIGINRDVAGKMLASQLTGLGIDERSARQQAGDARFDLSSQLTARGAFHTPAGQRGRKRIDQSLTNQLGQIQESRNQARLGNRREMAGYDLAETRAKNRQAGLDLATQRLGLDEKNLRLGLDKGLHDLGLSAFMSTNDILDALGSTDQARADLAAQILQQAMGFSASGLTPPNPARGALIPGAQEAAMAARFS